ncbi:hypothetical protein [Phenylobacterium sp.]|uniref:terminase small subunit-like protein n=1 Tax=Phenylobacterium sp. TaxID=1871053 RepID=UPI003D29F216
MPSYTPDQIAAFKAAIFDRRAAGESLELICSRTDWPSRPTLRKWARQDPRLAGLIAAGRHAHVHDPRPRFPFDPARADRLLIRIRLGFPIGDIIREPGMPHRRELNAWKLQDRAFAKALDEAKAFADASRRRHGATSRGYRRSRMPFDQDVADRIVLAVSRGATLPSLYRERAFPTRLGLRRWRRTNPEFERVLRAAAKAGHRARGKARVDRHCSPDLMDEIGRRIAAGASLHSLSQEPDMPSPYALYKWIRDRPDFAAKVADACDFRSFLLHDEALDHINRHGPAARPLVGAINKRLGQLNPYPGERRARRGR